MNSAGRSYSSTLRADQAEQTRGRIVKAAVDLLSEGDAGDLSMNEVAARAGVSVRTVYRNFATRDDLLDGVVGWINEELDHRVGPQPRTRREYEAVVPDVFSIVFDIEPLYRALFATHAGRASHRRSAATRRREVRRAFAAEMAELEPDAAKRLGAVLHLVSSSNAALFMKDYWGLSPEDVGRALRWATATLADAARDRERREQL